MTYLMPEHMDEIVTTAQAIVADNKGLLAADESAPTIAKRFNSIMVDSTEENRRFYRETLFSTPGAEEYISGVILFEETLGQSNSDGAPFPVYLAAKGIIPGIKVDLGLRHILGCPGESFTLGLDSLEERCIEYRDMGARFAKWRSVFHIMPQGPSHTAVEINTHALGQYASICQHTGLVPIVEPEILITGNHDIETAKRVSLWVLGRVFDQLLRHQVVLEGIILKPSMVTPGDGHPDQPCPETVARATVETFKRVVPAAVPGITFLSGGQTPLQATANLNAMNQLVHLPWKLSFSFGRALQEDALKTWAGNPNNKSLIQDVFYHRAKCNGAACEGMYRESMDA
ncbi:MAG: fructose-bisphosphate aldolase class I [Desulfovibrionales bacterium]|nr:fructose-bisphosphate aldolase class I [Desulfovibrionales bacterium]